MPAALPRLRSAVALGVLAAAALAGCSDPPQELSVRFAVPPGAAGPDTGQVDAARAACPGSGTVRVKPLSTSPLLSERAAPLRYDVTGSTDQTLALLEGCLQRQPGVSAFNLSGRTGD